MDRARPRPGLGCAVGCGSVRTHQPAGPSKYKADFVPLSFYKIFGYPTGIGALLARREVLKKLHRPWFAGGTITVASVQGDKYYLAEAPAAFEDGTLDYLNIPAVEID